MFIAGFFTGALFATVMLLLIGRSWNRRETRRVLTEMDMADHTVRARSVGRLAKAPAAIQ